jgi:hypothetical protein
LVIGQTAFVVCADRCIYPAISKRFCSH